MKKTIIIAAIPIVLPVALFIFIIAILAFAPSAIRSSFGDWLDDNRIGGVIVYVLDHMSWIPGFHQFLFWMVTRAAGL